MACSTLKRPCEIEDVENSNLRYMYPYSLKRHSDITEFTNPSKKICLYSDHQEKRSLYVSQSTIYHQLHTIEEVQIPNEKDEFDSDASSTSLCTETSKNQSVFSENIPKYSLTETTSICNEMIKNMESDLKKEFAKVLSEKLSEQYDNFVKFNKDWILPPLDSDCWYVC